MKLRTKIHLEAAFAAACSSVFLLTLWHPTWIEEVFALAPDQGCGETEWMVMAALGIGGIGFSVLARRDWVRMRSVVAR